MMYQAKTVDEAVDYVLGVLTEQDKDALRDMPEHEVTVNTHFGLGMWIRNNLGLWRGNQGLLDSGGSYHPDDVSSVIVKALWQRLQTPAQPADRE